MLWVDDPSRRSYRRRLSPTGIPHLRERGWDFRYWQILLQKSFWEVGLKFSDP